MRFMYVLFATTFVCVNAGSSYQFLRFQKPTGSQSKSGKSAHSRTSRGFRISDNDFYNNLNQDFNNNGLFLPPESFFDFDSIPHEVHKFSYELNEVHDPYLLTGNAAKQAARYIYGRGQLFFGQYPHVKALLKNQEKRQANGLAGNRLGSLRANSPFHRYGKPVYFNWYI